MSSVYEDEAQHIFPLADIKKTDSYLFKLKTHSTRIFINFLFIPY